VRHDADDLSQMSLFIPPPSRPRRLPRRPKPDSPPLSPQTKGLRVTPEKTLRAAFLPFPLAILPSERLRNPRSELLFFSLFAGEMEGLQGLQLQSKSSAQARQFFPFLHSKRDLPAQLAHFRATVVPLLFFCAKTVKSLFSPSSLSSFPPHTPLHH